MYGVQIAVFTMNTLPGEKSDYDGRVVCFKKSWTRGSLAATAKTGLS